MALPSHVFNNKELYWRQEGTVLREPERRAVLKIAQNKTPQILGLKNEIRDSIYSVAFTA